MTTLNITFCLLTYQSDLNLLKKNLNLLKDQSLITVDQSESTNEVINTIFNAFPKLQSTEIFDSNNEQTIYTSNQFTLIKPNQNLGYSGGMNKAIEQALKNHSSWIVLLNDDVELTTKSIEILQNQLKNAQPGIFGNEPGLLDQKRWTSVLSQTTNTPDYLSGSFLAIHSDVFNVIGTFYQPYFMYYEDVDFCTRARNAGFPLTSVELPGVIHTNKPKTKLASAKEYYLARNHLFFIFRLAPLQVKLHELIRLPKTLWQHKVKQNHQAFQGIIDALIHRTGKVRFS